MSSTRRVDRVIDNAPILLDGPMNSAMFLDDVEQCLAPSLEAGDTERRLAPAFGVGDGVVMHNLGEAKAAGVEEAIGAVRACGGCRRAAQV